MTYLWIVSFLLILALLFLTVPSSKIRRYNLFGLVSGFLLGILTLYFMVTIFNYWSFTPDFLTFAGIPVFLALTWWPLEIAFAYFFVKGGMKDFTSYALILVPAILSTLFHAFAIRLGLLQYFAWSYYATLLLSVTLHVLLAFYLRARVKVNELN